MKLRGLQLHPVATICWGFGSLEVNIKAKAVGFYTPKETDSLKVPVRGLFFLPASSSSSGKAPFTKLSVPNWPQLSMSSGAGTMRGQAVAWQLQLELLSSSECLTGKGPG